MGSIQYCTSSALPLLPLGRTCFCLTLPGFRNPITVGPSVIPVLLVVLAGLCGREEAQHSLWLGCLSYKTPVALMEHNQLFQETSSKSQAPAKVLGCQSLGCWQVSWHCWAPSNSHLLPGVPRVTWRCFPGTAACSWQCGSVGSGKMGRGEWLGRVPGAAELWLRGGEAAP